jgi:putative endonuclease
MPSLSKTIGQVAENLACEYLQQQGLMLVAANYQCRCGEIDLVMWDVATLVFVEVRHRKVHDYGDGVSTVTRVKQRKIIKTANYYLYENKMGNSTQYRFDVVATSGIAGNEIIWIKDAFWEKW